MVTRVAVVGCGAAGLSALKHLTARSKMFTAVGFEQLPQAGGTWIYSSKTGVDSSSGLSVQSSMYRNLRTNIPKEVMAFPGHPFPNHLPSFIPHKEVLKYLQGYCDTYDLSKHIKYETKLDKIEPIGTESGTEWKVSYSSVPHPDNTASITVDAVMVCNGHYEVPLSPNIPGMEDFQGTILHSHDYREPENYTGHTVVCLGGAASGQDISLDIATEAKKVIISHNKVLLSTPLPSNVQQQTGIKRLKKNSVVFNNGHEEKVDTIVLCTGYRYNFPFLDDKCKIQIDDERMTPLYKHIIHADYPSLSFIGMCKTICPFPQFDCQVQFVLSALDGTQKLPSSEEMKNDSEREYRARLNEGLPPRHAHTMGERQWAYNSDLANLGKFSPIPQVVQDLYNEVHRIRIKNLPEYKNKQYELVNEKEYKEYYL